MIKTLKIFSVVDIVWQHLSTLSSFAAFSLFPQTFGRLKFATALRLLPHPFRLCLLAGDLANHKMIANFHAFLTTLALILQSGASASVDSRLKCLCFRAWTFQLTIHEQVNIFSQFWQQFEFFSQIFKIFF